VPQVHRRWGVLARERPLKTSTVLAAVSGRVTALEAVADAARDLARAHSMGDIIDALLILEKKLVELDDVELGLTDNTRHPTSKERSK